MVTDLELSQRIPKARQRILIIITLSMLVTIGAGIFACGIAYYALGTWDKRPIRHPLQNTFNFSLLGIAIFYVVMAGAFTLLFVRFLKSPKPGMLLDAEGFEYWKFVRIVERISWHDIERIEKKQDLSVKFLVGWLLPDLFNFVTIYHRDGLVTKKRIRPLNRMLGMGDVIIDHRYLAANAYEVYDLMTLYWKRSTGSENEFSNYPRP